MSNIQYICSYESPLGPMTMASDGEYLIGLWFDGQKYDRAALKGKEVIEREALPVFDETRKWLDLYFGKAESEEGVFFVRENVQEPGFTPQLRVVGSKFRQMVSSIMLSIPYGETMTYGEIGKEAAKRMGKKSMSAQAVGGAVGHNPISVIIPCHRVVGADGKLTGYAGGIEKKMALLKLESRT